MDVASRTMGLDFELTWKPFFLDPRLPGGKGKDKMEHYRAKFGAERVAQMMPHMVRTFENEGIPNYSMGGRVGNTMDSHRLLEHAVRIGGPAKQDALVEKLFERYFVGGQALSDRAVLLEAADAVALDGAREVLESGELTEEVWHSVEGAYSAGVTGVPYFRIDGGGRGKELSGGQEPDVFLRVFSLLKPPEGPATPPGGHTIGTTVSIAGLQARPELNGKLAEVVGAQGQRVQVRLTDGTQVALKPANLHVHMPSGAANVDVH
jgi:predicted DsbA family dithiol-disulfide isomerase